MSLNNIALAHWSNGDLESKQVFFKAYEISVEVLGGSHPTTLQILNNYGFVIADQGDFGLAASLLEKSVKLTEDTLTKDHPNLEIIFDDWNALCEEI